MSEKVRILNDDGADLFREYLSRLRDGSREPAPKHILFDSKYSSEFDSNVTIGSGPFLSREDFGRRLNQWLAPEERRTISRQAGLWNWLALYFLDDLCPVGSKGQRSMPLAPSHYVLEKKFVYNRYYRHLVRFSWLSVGFHGAAARILLTAAEVGASGIGQWGDVSERLGAYQGIFGSQTVIKAAGLIFMDATDKIIRGAAGSGPGSARRFVAVLKQLGLTYDLRTAAAEDIIALLPKEFDRFKREYEKRLPRGNSRG